MMLWLFVKCRVYYFSVYLQILNTDILNHPFEAIARNNGKFGILSMKKAKDGDLAVYELKPQYAELVERVISSA